MMKNLKRKGMKRRNFAGNFATKIDGQLSDNRELCIWLDINIDVAIWLYSICQKLALLMFGFSNSS
jgi:hypothetical protein